MSTKSTPKPQPKKARAPRVQGKHLVPVPVTGYLRRFRCGCEDEAKTQADLKPWCPKHLRDPDGAPMAILSGQSKPDAAVMGRPTKYSGDMAKMVCDRIAQGWRQRHFETVTCIKRLVELEGHELEEAIRIADTLPGKATIIRWLGEHDDFRVLYARAKMIYIEHGLGEEAEEIADDASQDYILTPKGLALDNEHISRSKLRVEQRRWTMDRLMPVSKTLTLKGDKDAPLLVGRAGALQLSDEELMAEIVARRDERRTLEGPKPEVKK